MSDLVCATDVIHPNPREAVIFDSLAYIEQGLVSPDYETYAITLIDQEMQACAMVPDPFTTTHKIPSFGTRDGAIGMNQVEYVQLLERNGGPRPHPIDFNQNTISQSLSSLDPDEMEMHVLEKRVQAAKVELEYERVRLVNLELQAEFESDLWKYHNSMLDLHQNQPIQKALEQQKRRVDTVNAKRKYQQESHMAPKLRILEDQWRQLIATNQQLAQAVSVLEDEVYQATGEASDRPLHPSSHEGIAFMDNTDDDGDYE